MRDGEYTDWYLNGQLWEHFVSKDGKLDGEYTLWNENGQLRKHCVYKDGECSKLNGEYKQWYKKTSVR
jgi:antitoxin component YwqK of YwqJK toxin-antitoxin module